jgi:hypothetical protein
VNIFGIFHWFDVLWHWIVAFINVIAVAGFGVLGFMWSPVFKSFFLGIAVGACALAAVNLDIINFNKMLAPEKPQVCINPTTTDPNGPVARCFHKTDERGYGYWGACDGQQ